MPYLDDLIGKLNKLPPQVLSLLRKIREQDKIVQQTKLQMELQKAQFFKTLENWQHNKSNYEREKAQRQYVQIMKKDKIIHQLSKQKVQLAENLYTLVHEPTQKLDKQLLHRNKERNVNMNGKIHKKDKSRKHRLNLTGQKWQYQSSEPIYCYCGKPSYGQMVMCQNTYCDKQWFHLQCIDEKISNTEKWYCKNCRKVRDNSRLQNKNKKR